MEKIIGIPNPKYKLALSCRLGFERLCYQAPHGKVWALRAQARANSLLRMVWTSVRLQEFGSCVVMNIGVRSQESTLERMVGTRSRALSLSLINTSCSEKY